jgi:hypothetical protein
MKLILLGQHHESGDPRYRIDVLAPAAGASFHGENAVDIFALMARAIVKLPAAPIDKIKFQADKEAAEVMTLQAIRDPGVELRPAFFNEAEMSFRRVPIEVDA